MKRVFPILPILSRTELGIAWAEDLPAPHVVDEIPTHLLAAVYGSALPFASEDDHLAPITIYEKPQILRI